MSIINKKKKKKQKNRFKDDIYQSKMFLIANQKCN